MGWTTIRLKQETKEQLDQQIEGRNMQEKVDKLLNSIDSYIEETVKQEVQKLSINQRTGEIEYQ